MGGIQGKPLSHVTHFAKQSQSMRGSRASAHLEDPVTRRDIFGVVRGSCTQVG